eukprot:1190727-Prorocentrum_minimum.AAC.1
MDQSDSGSAARVCSHAESNGRGRACADALRRVAEGAGGSAPCDTAGVIWGRSKGDGEVARHRLAQVLRVCLQHRLVAAAAPVALRRKHLRHGIFSVVVVLLVTRREYSQSLSPCADEGLRLRSQVVNPSTCLWQPSRVFGVLRRGAFLRQWEARDGVGKVVALLGRWERTWRRRLLGGNGGPSRPPGSPTGNRTASPLAWLAPVGASAGKSATAN